MPGQLTGQALALVNATEMEQPRTLRHGDGSSARAAKPRAPPLSTHCLAGGASPLRHVSPRKFHQIQQQQRAAVLRAMPLSPLSARTERESTPGRTESERSVVYEPREPVPWNPAWLSEPALSGADATNTKAVEALLRAAGAMGSSPTTSVGNMTLDAWLESYEREFLTFESLEKFVQVKLPEALAFCDKIEQQSRASASSSNTHSAGAASGAFPSSRFHVRLRVAVFAHLVERTVFALAQSASLAHAKRTLFQARQEIFRAMFADYDARPSAASEQTSGPGDSDASDEDEDESRTKTRSQRRQRQGTRAKTEDSGSERNDSDASSSDTDADASARSRSRKPKSRYDSTQYGPTAAPRTLAFFLTKVPFALKLREDTQRRAVRFKRHQVVLRRIVQSLYRSLGSVFHAWKLLVRQKREERLNNKGAQLTAMVVQQRGLVRSVFVEWSKATLRARIKAMKTNERELKQQHEQVLGDLHREIFLLRERTRALELELHESQRYRPVSRKPRASVVAATGVETSAASMPSRSEISSPTELNELATTHQRKDGAVEDSLRQSLTGNTSANSSSSRTLQHATEGHDRRDTSRAGDRLTEAVSE